MWFGSEPAVPGTFIAILINEKCPYYVHKAWASQPSCFWTRTQGKVVRKGMPESLTQSKREVVRYKL